MKKRISLLFSVFFIFFNACSSKKNLVEQEASPREIAPSKKAAEFKKQSSPEDSFPIIFYDVPDDNNAFKW